MTIGLQRQEILGPPENITFVHYLLQTDKPQKRQFIHPIFHHKISSPFTHTYTQKMSLSE